MKSLRKLHNDTDDEIKSSDRVVILIKACIYLGFNTANLIVGAVRKLGFNNRHVGAVLTNCTGDDPNKHHWQLIDGQYYVFRPEDCQLPTG